MGKGMRLDGRPSWVVFDDDLGHRSSRIYVGTKDGSLCHEAIAVFGSCPLKGFIHEWMSSLGRANSV
jgi:hypothetical protein